MGSEIVHGSWNWLQSVFTRQRYRSFPYNQQDTESDELIGINDKRASLSFSSSLNTGREEQRKDNGVHDEKEHCFFTSLETEQAFDHKSCMPSRIMKSTMANN